MHIDFIVEEPSAEEALTNLLAKILDGRATFRIINLGGKPRLLRKLPSRLRGYKYILSEDRRLVILVDRDDDDCRQLKIRLEEHAAGAGLATKSSVGAGDIFLIVNRIIVEELEAWFFGDICALTKAYPRVPRSLGHRAKYRDPDAISGGTCEALHKVLREAGYHRAGFPKTEVARAVSRHMEPLRNRSRSFQIFVDGLSALLSNHPVVVNT
jgi:hypothetical protein